MFRLIQVPLDGSSFAEHALALAVRLAQRDGADLQVIRVHVPMADAYLYRQRPLFANLDRELMDHAREHLDAIVTSLADDTGLRATPILLECAVPEMIAHEQPATAILDTVSSLGADAIALTTRGQGGLKRLLLGSVADKVLRGSTTPVLICPPVTGPVGIEIKE